MAKITKKEILKVCKTVHESVEYLNHGGCGVFAFLLGSTLNQFENCQVKVKVVDYYGNFHKRVEFAVPEDFTNVDNWTKNGLNFNHIILEVKLKYCKPFYLDSTGVYQHEGILVGSLDLIHIEAISKVNRGWNSTFNRKQIPKIICYIKSFFDNDRSLCNNLVIKHWELN